MKSVRPEYPSLQRWAEAESRIVQKTACKK